MPYTLDINEYVRRISARVSTNLMIRKEGRSLGLSDLEKEILEALPDLDKEDTLCLYHELNRVENELPEAFYKKEFIVLDKDGTPNLYSTLAKMIELNNANFEGFKSYGHAKFFQLGYFVHNNEPKK